MILSNIMLKFCLELSSLTVVFGGNILQKSQIDNNNDFNMELFGELIKDHGNLVYSGSSIHRILALTAMGARGETAEQLKKVLKLTGSDEQIKKDFKALTTQMNDAKDVTINAAMKAYLAKGIPIETEFQKTATEYFAAEVQNINFKNSTYVVNTINSWVEQKTHGNIKNLVKEGSIEDNTRFIFIDTIYFLGHFLHPFESWATKKKDFHISKTQTVKVDMMQLSANVLFSRDAKVGVNMILLPYQDIRAQLLIVLPDSIEQRANVEKNVKDMWHHRNFTNQYMKIFLPKFRVESTLNLKPILKNMGITKLFTQPDLSGITKGEIVLAAVTQKTVIDTNEFGTEAASATADKVVLAKFLPNSLELHDGEPIVFNVDRPFGFAILYDEFCIMSGRVQEL